MLGRQLEDVTPGNISSLNGILEVITTSLKGDKMSISVQVMFGAIRIQIPGNKLRPSSDLAWKLWHHLEMAEMLQHINIWSHGKCFEILFMVFNIHLSTNTLKNKHSYTLQTFYVLTSQLFGHCDIITNQLWCHQYNVNQMSETRVNVWRSSFPSSFITPFCHVWNKIIHVLACQTVYVLTLLLFWSLFPSSVCNHLLST